MSVPQSNPQIREDLLKIVEQVELRFADKGFTISKAEILGYLLEVVIIRNKMDYSELIKNYGSADTIASELASKNDIIWPVDPWYGSQISFQKHQSVDQTKSSNFMKSVITAHNISLIASIYILTRVLLSIALALIRGDPASFEIVIDFTPYNIGVFFWYPLFSILAYSHISRISHNTELRAGVDDMELWLNKIKKTSYFHTIVLFAFYGFYFLGSISVLTISGRDTIQYRPANGVTYRLVLQMIIISLYFYLIGLKKLFYGSCGGEYWHIEPYRRRSVKYLFNTLLYTKQVIVLSELLLFIYITKYYDTLKQYQINVLLGVDETYIIIALFYFFVIIALLSIIWFSPPTNQAKYWLRSSIQTDIFYILSMGLLSYQIMQIKLIVVNNRIESLPGYTPSIFRDFFILPFIVLFSTMVMVQFQYIMFKRKFGNNIKLRDLIFKNGYSLIAEIESKIIE